jgi:hypothetical protein
VKQKIKNLIFFAVTIIASLVLINVVNHMLFLRWIDKYGKDMDAVRYSDQLTDIVVAFHDEYRQWPGPPGPINDAFICELEGCPNAKINSQHIDFYKKYSLKVMKKNKFGYYFRFELDDKDPIGFLIENLSPDPKTGLPVD